MNISQKGIFFIADFEGLKLKAYKDVAGLWTIGYGHLLTDLELQSGHLFTTRFDMSRVKIDWRKGLSNLEATDLLTQDVQFAVNAVKSFVKVDLKQNEFDMLVSFIFNVGAGAFQKSTLLKLLNSHQKHLAAEQFTRWVKVGGKVINGLVRRRQSEKQIFLNGYK